MKALLKVAVRNVFAHRLKTLIVGSLIFLGIFLIVLGNSFLDSTSRGIQKAYSHSVTGEIAILKNIDFDFSLFGTWNNMGNLSVPVMPHLEETREFLEDYPGVREVTTVSSNMAMVNTGEASPDYWIMTMAVDPASYTRFFDTEDSLILHEGRFLEPGEEGMVISKAVAEYLLEYKGMEVHPGDSLLLNGYSANGFRIREVPIRGIYEYRYVKGDMYPMLPRTTFIDQQNFNLLNGIVVSQHDNKPTEEMEELLFTDSFEDLFSDTVEVGTADAVHTDLEALMGDLSVRQELSQVDNNDWQWLLLSLENRDDSYIKQLREDLEVHFNQQFSSFHPEDVLKADHIARTLLQPERAEHQYLSSLLTQEQREEIDQAQLFMMEEELQLLIADFFTGLLEMEDFYHRDSFEGVYFTSITKNLTEDSVKDYELIRRNRLILEETYPFALNPGPDYMVSEWWHAAAPMSSTVMGLKWVLNLSLTILFIVTIIIIMNTLIISVMERTGEIGTIRAMGGRKSFIFSLFTTETLTISLLFGILGLAAGSLVLFFLGRSGIPAEEGSMLQMIAGGGTIYPSLSLWTVGLSGLFMVVVGLLSSIYPVIFALKVEPVEAMRQD